MKIKLFISIVLLLLGTFYVQGDIPCSMGVERYTWDCFIWKLSLHVPAYGEHGTPMDITYYIRFHDFESQYGKINGKEVYTVGYAYCSEIFRGSWETVDTPWGQKVLSFCLNKNSFNLTYDYIGDYNICGNALYVTTQNELIPSTFELFNVTDGWLHCFPWTWPWYQCPW